MSKAKKASPYAAAVPVRDKHPMPEAAPATARPRVRPPRLIGDATVEDVALLHALAWALSGSHGQILRAGLDALLKDLEPDIQKLVRRKLATTEGPAGK